MASAAPSDDLSRATPERERQEVAAGGVVIRGERLAPVRGGDQAVAGVERVLGSRLTQDPLDRYCARCLLWPQDKRLVGDRRARNLALHQAGDRLRRDHYLAGLSPRVIGRYGQEPAAGGDPDGLRQHAALQRYRRAAVAVGMVLSPVVMHVCCHGGDAGDWAAGRGMPAREGIVLLRAGLQALADHYGLWNPAWSRVA